MKSVTMANGATLQEGPSTAATRILLMVLCGSILAAVVGAPILATQAHPLAAAFLYLLFSPVCHQIPDRCFTFSGQAWAVCHRCSGIYLGMFLALLTPFTAAGFLRSARETRGWVLVLAAPMLIDVAAPYLGWWVSTPSSRFLTGVAFGVLVSSLLLPGISELLDHGSRKHLRLRTAPPEGEIG
mgnify:CR=1 FL=1